jgi:hypothetical protein
MINIIYFIVIVFKAENFRIRLINIIYYTLLNYFKKFKFYNLILIFYIL